MRNGLWAGGLAVGIVAAGVLAAGCAVARGPEEVAKPVAAPTVQEPAAPGSPEGEVVGKRPVRYFKLFADNWSWEPDTIRVKKGTHVVVTARAYRATRSFELKKYKLDVLLPQDEEVKFEFDADKVGEFPFRCGRPCGNGCAKMRGKLIVTE